MSDAYPLTGLAAPLRMMCLYAKTPFHNVSYPSGGPNTWFDTDKPNLLTKQPLINLPYIIDGDQIISQSNACLSYLGRKFGLWGNTPSEISVCEMTICEIADLRNKMVEFAYSGIEDSDKLKEAALKLLVDASPSFAKLNSVFAANAKGKGTFLVSDHATPADFYLYHVFDQYASLANFFGQPGWIDGFPHVKAFSANFEQLPENAAYLNSILNKMPYNGSDAVFGSCPDLSQKFDKGAKAPAWHSTTGDFAP